MYVCLYRTAQALPFTVQVKTDADEVAIADNVGAAGVGKTNEQDLAPGGIVGFSLNFMQLACTWKKK